MTGTRSPAKKSSPIQFSLIDLLMLTVAASFTLAALKFSGISLTLFTLFVLIVFLAILIIAICDRKKRQASAIGFSICWLVYIVVLWLSGTPEFDPYAGKMPTTKMMQPIFDSMAEREWFNTSTGEVLEDYTPPAPKTMSGKTGGGGFGGGGLGGFVVVPRETLDRKDFMLASHLGWMLLLGFLGGKFAGLVYSNRTKSE